MSLANVILNLTHVILSIHHVILSEVEGSRGLGNGDCLQTKREILRCSQNDRQEGLGITSLCEDRTR